MSDPTSDTHAAEAHAVGVPLLPGERPDKARFTIVIQPADDAIPEPVRLRRMLKWLGRRCGLTVLHVAERHEPVLLSPVDPVSEK